MRRVNWAFAVGLFLVIAVAAGAVHGLHVVRYGKIADDLRWQADRAREEGRPDDAIKFAGQYLDFRPADVGMMADLATWLREKATTRKQFGRVLGLYDRILRYSPDDTAIRQKSAELAMGLGEWAAALENFDVLLHARPGDAELCEDYAYCLQAIGKYDESAAWYERSVRADPKRATAYVGHAVVLDQYLKKSDKALARLEEACRANPQSGLAQAARAEALRMRGRLNEAAEAVALAEKAPPGDDREQQTIIKVAADVAQSNGQPAVARKLLEDGYRKYPKNPRFVCNLAWQQALDGRADLAIATLRAAHDANPLDAEILTLLGDLLAHDGQVGPLEDTLRQLTEMNVEPHWAQYVQARLLILRGRWAEAAGLLDRIRMVALPIPSLYLHANLLLAQCYEQLGDSAAELDAYRRLLEHDPTAGPPRLDFALALARAGQTDEAVSQFLTVVSRPEVPSRAVAESTRELIERLRSDPKAWARLEKAVDAFKVEKDNPNPTLVRAYLDLARHRAADRMAAIDGLVRTNPRSVAVHIARALLTEQALGLDRALKSLADAEAIVGDHADVRVSRARLLTARLDPTAADALSSLARSVERFPADDRARILWELIADFRMLGDSAAVGLHLDSLAQLRPDLLAAREAQFARALKAGDGARQQALRREVESIEGPDGSTARLLDAQEALWLAKPGDTTTLAKATEQLVAAARGRPHDPVVEFLRGRVDELAGHPVEALHHYEIAFDGGLAERPVEDLFANLLGKNGDAPVAVLRDQLPLAGRLRPDRHRALIVTVADLYTGTARDAFAARLTAAAPPADAVTLTWLGRLFARLKLDGPAEDCFRRATTGAPQSPEGWLALVAFQAGRQNSAGINAVANQVRDRLPPVEAHLVIGQALESVRQLDAAQKEYESAAALAPDDTRLLKLLANLAMARNQPEEARKRLEQIVALTSPTAPEDQAWARRTLALQLATTPAADGFNRALALIEQNKIDGQLPDDDQRTRVLVLATQKSRSLPGGETTARREAIRVLEELRKRGTARSADDLILLARLYREEGDEPKARQAREQMAAEYASHFGCAVFLAREALREHDLPGCERLLPAVRRLGPGQFDGLAVDFQYQVLAGRAEFGVRLLNAFVAASPSADERSARTIRCANLIYDLLQVHPADDQGSVRGELRVAAIRLYRPAAERDADAFQKLITLLAATPDGTGQAIDLVQRQKRVFGPAFAANAYVQIMRHGKPGPNDLQRRAIGQFVRSELEKSPQSSSLLLTSAEYLQLTGDNPGAVRVYREVLKLEPENILALNNLAWTFLQDRPDEAKLRDALGLIQRAIDLAGPIDELLDTRGRILFASGQRDAGLRDMREAATESPSAARLTDYAAMLQRAGKVQEAERALAEARRFTFGETRSNYPGGTP